MANICTNMLYCKTDNAENYKRISDFLEEQFDVNFLNEDEDNYSVESEFYSKWSFPEKKFEQLLSLLEADDTLYMRILSHELCCEYASFRIYKDKMWDIQF